MSPNPDAHDALLDEALQALQHVLRRGRPPGKLSASLANNAHFQELVKSLENLHDFTFAIANGDLSLQLKLRGNIAGSLKSLQASLRHLTWQTQRVADGDFSQRVDFMGDFSVAFNTMVEHLQAAYDELNQRQAELEAHNAELDAFAHTVAHDLKTPLTALLGFSSLLENRYAQMPPDKIAEYMRYISDNSNKMANIIDELLLLSSVRKLDDIPLGQVNMADITAEARQRLHTLVTQSQANIVQAATWPVAIGYAPWIEEVWVNYLSNALKYGGTPPHIELGHDPPTHDKVRFWVRDNGPGITPEQQTRLFTEFARLNRNHVEGHGLGLSIVQRIIHKLNGKVGVESERGQGSTFWFTLPAA